MKLRELEASFVTAGAEGGIGQLPDAQGAQGVMFKCPLCAQGAERNQDGHLVGVHMVLVWFVNPEGAPPAPPDRRPLPRWTRTGTTLDDLTLSPSISLDVPGATGCRWHGYVFAGTAA